jgi:hypothetical protein
MNVEASPFSLLLINHYKASVADKSFSPRNQRKF